MLQLLTVLSVAAAVNGLSVAATVYGLSVAAAVNGLSVDATVYGLSVAVLLALHFLFNIVFPIQSDALPHRIESEWSLGWDTENKSKRYEGHKK
ncbi:hypothetical protein [Methanolapillus ohkumae]|uniref:hypothetical protein n=1 Tax=Methanolapillus ohkumae TaxID=3028298 RepID=UPI0030B91BD2